MLGGCCKQGHSREMPWQWPDWGTGCFNKLSATHVRRNYIKGNVLTQCPQLAHDLSFHLPLSIFFLHFLLHLLPVFTGVEQRWACPCCPLRPVPATSSDRTFWGCSPGFPWPEQPTGCFSPSRVPCQVSMATLEVINLPVPEREAQTGAIESTEATYMRKELLKDLLYLLSGREPIILFLFFKLSVYF